MNTSDDFHFKSILVFFIKIVYYSNIYNLYNKNTIKQFVAKI